MPSDENRKPKGPKPWRNRVKLRQNAKASARKDWSAGQWQRYAEDRDARRARPRRGRMLKEYRLELLRAFEVSAARAERMRDINAERRKRRAAASAT